VWVTNATILISSENVTKVFVIDGEGSKWLIKFLSLSNPSELCPGYFPGQLCWPMGINKDPTVWLDGAR
jgi:hypothetical protein